MGRDILLAGPWESRDGRDRAEEDIQVEGYDRGTLKQPAFLA